VPTRRRIQIEATAADPRHKLAQAVGTYLNGCGFYETINVDFVDQAAAEVFSAGGTLGHLGVRDVTRKAGNLLRRTLLASLLEVLQTNVNAKNLPCRIYEIADTFIPTGVKDALPRERTARSGRGRRIRCCVVRSRLIKHPSRGGGEFVLAELPGRDGARVLVNGQVMGEAGVFSDAVRERLIRTWRCGAELDFDELLALGSGSVKIKPIPRFPAIERDLSLVVAEPIMWADIARAVQEVAPAELEEVRFIDIYRGKGVAPGAKSVTLSLRFRDEDGTLTHEAVDKYQAAILESLQRAVGELRTLTERLPSGAGPLSVTARGGARSSVPGFPWERQKAAAFR
jgi:phenylalanyl-tRNA synthetase beta chain